MHEKHDKAQIHFISLILAVYPRNYVTHAKCIANKLIDITRKTMLPETTTHFSHFSKWQQLNLRIYISPLLFHVEKRF